MKRGEPKKKKMFKIIKKKIKEVARVRVRVFGEQNYLN